MYVIVGNTTSYEPINMNSCLVATTTFLFKAGGPTITMRTTMFKAFMSSAIGVKGRLFVDLSWYIVLLN